MNIWSSGATTKSVWLVGRAPIDCVAHGADVHSLCPAAIGNVCLGEVVGVECVERRRDLVGHVLVELVGPHELRVDDGDAAVLRRVIGGRELVGFEEDIDGGVAVSVEVERRSEVIDPLDHLFDGLLRERQLTPPVFLTAWAAGQVRGGEEGGFSLW